MVVFGAVFTAALCGLAAVIVASQRDSRAALQDRFETRLVMAKEFVAGYTDDLLSRESAIGATRLGGDSLDPGAFEELAAGFGFNAALVLDGDGRVLAVHPSAPALLRTRLVDRYAHLREAAAGTPTVSGLVPSAAEQKPVVAFAAPFPTATGERRVLSGAFGMEGSPIGAYLRHAIPIRGHELFLLDDGGVVLAGTRGMGKPLGKVDGALAAALAGGARGSYDKDGDEHRYFALDVERRPWRIVQSAPTRQLYRPLGPTTYTSWLVFAFLALVGTLVLGLVRKLYLREAALEGLSHQDPLTGLANRRRLDDAVARIDAGAARYGTTTGVLALDVDHFKRVNDTYGHAVGDVVLRAVAARMEATVRPTDVVARLGGEEFLAILPATDVGNVAAVAERLRVAVAAPVTLDSGASVSVTVSIGCAAGPQVATLLRTADAAVYQAKAAGRDRVVVGYSADAASGSSSSAAELMQ